MPKEKWHDRIVYHELEQIGKGAIGSVSRVMDLQDGSIMAVKIIHVESGIEKDRKETAKREVEILASLEHVSLSFVSCFGYMLIVMYSSTLLALCTRKVGNLGKQLRYSCPLPTALCEIIQAQECRKERLP